MVKSSRTAGRHFLQIPGPTPIPERIQQAMSRQILDHRGPEFAQLAISVIQKLKAVVKTEQHLFVYPSSGTGAWEAGLVNTLSPGDRVLMVETGQFAALWREMADRLGLNVTLIPTDWRIGADPERIEDALRADTNHEIQAVCVVQNETSTGCSSPIADIRKVMDAVGHPALLMVDTISSVGAMDYQHDAWRVDVAVGGSQKGLMMPPGLSFTAVSDKAFQRSKTAQAGLKRSYWSWADMSAGIDKGSFPYTPATGLLYALDEAINLLTEEGLDAVFARHERLAAATRAAVSAWGLETQCVDERYHSPAVTAVRLPEGFDADAFRADVLQTFNMSLGAGLGKVAGRVFRIGHLGDTNKLTVLGALAGVEMGLKTFGVPHAVGGVDAAMASFTRSIASRRAKAA